MSYKPDWIEIDHCILVNGKEEVVRAIGFFTEASSGALAVKIGDQWHEFGLTATMEPLPAPQDQLPAHIKIGEPVVFGDEEDIGFVSRAWLKRKKGETTGEIRVETWQSPFSHALGKIRPVSSSQEDAEKMGAIIIEYASSMCDFSYRVQRLLEAGADISLCNERGRTALEIARDVGKDKVADLIEAEQRRRDLAFIEKIGMQGIPTSQARPPGRLVMKKKGPKV